MKIGYNTMIVQDMEESIRFYTEVMGFEVDSRYNPLPDTFITLMKGKGDTMIELIQNPAYDIGFYSIGMTVDDLAATLDELKSKGARITGGPLPITDGSLAFMEDPNGVRIALICHNARPHLKSSIS